MISLSRVDIAEIATVARPDAHLVGRSHGHDDEPLEVGGETALPTKTFRQVGADRFRRPANLIAQRSLLNLRQGETDAMDFQGELISPPEDREVLHRTPTLLSVL